MKKSTPSMKSKKTVSSPEYLRKRLGDGGYTTLLAEMRREGPTGLVPLSEIHANEKLRESRVRASLIGSDQNLVVAIDTTTWLFGAYQVHSPEQELKDVTKSEDEVDTSNLEADQDVGKPIQDIGDYQIEMTTKAVETSKLVIDGVRAHTITSFEEIIDTIADKHLESLVFEILSQSKNPIMELETPQGRLVIGGHFDLADTIPSNILRTAICDVRDVNDDSHGCGSISFRIHEICDDVDFCPFPFLAEQQLTARFFTVNDQRAKRLLHYAKYVGQFALLELQFEYNLFSGKWNCLCVRIADEADLVAKERIPQGIFDAL
jgi:hypothetical protein